MTTYHPESVEQTFRATVGGLGVVDIVTDGTFQEIVLPEGIVCLSSAIQVQALTKTSFDPEDDCQPFEWSRDGAEDGYLFDPYGKGIKISKHGGNSLGFVKALAGYKVVVYAKL